MAVATKVYVRPPQAKQEVYEEAVRTAEAERVRRQQEAEEATRHAEELARKHEALVQSHQNFLDDKWNEHCRIHLDVPPELLALEKKPAAELFLEKLSRESMRIIESEAISRFRIGLLEGTQRARQAVKNVSRLLSIASVFSFGGLRSHLKSCSIEVEPPLLDSPGKEASQAAVRLLRRRWEGISSLRNQSLISVHRNGNATVFQIGSSTFGFIYLTFPHEILPPSMLKNILSKVLNCARNFVPAQSIVAVYDGEMQDINPKAYLRKHIVVRSITDNEANFSTKIAEVLKVEAPRPENTALHLALPHNEESLNAVFKKAVSEGVAPNWEVWEKVAPRWNQHASRARLEIGVGVAVGKSQILASLAVSRNVIIVAAHADEQILYLPAPPPEGSQIGSEDLQQHRDAIRKNRPMVYLFCCESAQIANLKSFASHLLDCGALAVVAPQSKIDALKSGELFERLIADNGSNSKALNRLLWAEKKSRYREMEVFLG